MAKCILASVYSRWITYCTSYNGPPLQLKHNDNSSADMCCESISMQYPLKCAETNVFQHVSLRICISSGWQYCWNLNHQYHKVWLWAVAVASLLAFRQCCKVHHTLWNTHTHTLDWSLFLCQLVCPVNTDLLCFDCFTYFCQELVLCLIGGIKTESCVLI